MITAASIATGIVASGLVSTVVTQFTKKHISDNKKVRTIWALCVSAGIGIISTGVSAIVNTLAGEKFSWAAFAAQLILGATSAAGAAQAIYSGVKALTPNAVDVDVNALVDGAKAIVNAAEGNPTTTTATTTGVTTDPATEE